MDFALEPLPPIFTAHLFPRIEAKLLELLRSLTPDDWERQTLAPKWKVKDVAAHLLDTQVRKIAAFRRVSDSESNEIMSGAELVALVNALNAEGVREYRRLSVADLVSRMEMVSRESAEYHQALDPFAPAMFPVSWAGEEQSPNWFDTAREYTERWHHQQQIRIAVQAGVQKSPEKSADDAGIMTRELYYPVLDCFMRGLPYAYRHVPARAGSVVRVNISGECGGSWSLLKKEDGWVLNASAVGDTISEASIPQDIAWRIFTKGITRDVAAPQLQVTGDAETGWHVLEMVSIVG